MPFAARTLRRLIPAAILLLIPVSVHARQADQADLVSQMNDLIKQLQATDDPCPLMPKFKALITRMANETPDTYNAMKPVLDLMNQDDTCAANAAPAPATSDQLTPEQIQEQLQKQREALRQQNLQRLQEAERKETAGKSPRGTAVPSGSNLSCNDVTHSVTLTVTAPTGFGHCDHEVVGHFVNNADGPVTCTTAFHHNGIWDDYGMGFLKQGESSGGEMSGFWSCGTDTNEIRYVCFFGDTPMDAKNHICNANIRWTD